MAACPVNTCPHTGAIRMLELLLGFPLQWVICGLQLLWWHIIFPPEVVKKLSRDQYVAYLYSHAVQNGNMPDMLVNMTIGPLVKSLWINCGVRVLCLYTRTKKPGKGLVRLVKVVLYLYFPGWLWCRNHSHIPPLPHPGWK